MQDNNPSFDGGGEPRDIDAFIAEQLDAEHGPSRPRLSGVETVRAELVAGVCWQVAGRAETFADGELRRAARFYGVHAAKLAEHYKSSEPTPWAELSAPTVRAWVAVAREAAKL